MTKAPERIWADQPKERGFYEAPPPVEYIRADLHAELMRAADELADEFEWFMDHIEEHYGVCMQSPQDALIAYKQAKEKNNAL